MAKDYKITVWNDKHVYSLALRANVKAMTKAAIVVEDYVKTHFTKQGSYRKYRRQKSKHIRTAITTGQLDRRFKKTGEFHWSSSPDEPPAIDTGNLMSSTMHLVKKTPNNVEGYVGIDDEKLKTRTAKSGKKGKLIPYGLFLELGTRKMAARPFLRPALKATRAKINEIFRKANL